MDVLVSVIDQTSKKLVLPCSEISSIQSLRPVSSASFV
jgi:hypothetical protein